MAMRHFCPMRNDAHICDIRIYICAQIFAVAAFLDVHVSTHVSPSVRKLVGDTFEFLFSISVSGCSTRTPLFSILGLGRIA